jgi:hypothetical protein
MTLKEKRIFFNWLQKQGALKQYKRNRFAYSHKCHTRANSYALMPFSYAVDAFVWRHTPEGFDFWTTLDYAWTLFARRYYDT